MRRENRRSGSCQGRIEILEDVVDILDPHGKADQLGGDPPIGLLLGTELPVLLATQLPVQLRTELPGLLVLRCALSSAAWSLPPS